MDNGNKGENNNRIKKMKVEGGRIKMKDKDEGIYG